MKEILTGIYHWTTVHPKIKIEVSSYYLADERVLIDPLIPAAGLASLPGKPEHVFLTNRHHYRDSAEFRRHFGCTVWCDESGLHEFTGGEEIEPFRHGDVLPGKITALEVGVICPDDTALLIPREDGVLAVADGVIRMNDGPLTFVPDQFMGDDPEGVKNGLKTSYRRIVDAYDFEHILLAHGWPWIGGGKEALGTFAT
jgi:hypothetical protein